jgi:hypothetical protein
MAWFKRIWLACLLAVAAGGQAPLWLHQLVCHCSSDSPLSCQVNGSQDAASSNVCAGHSHGAQPVSLERRADSRLPGLRDSHADADPCSACYALSQLSLTQARGDALGWIEPCTALRVSHDLSFSPRTFLAYGSRAPPVA